MKTRRCLVVILLNLHTLGRVLSALSVISATYTVRKSSADQAMCTTNKPTTTIPGEKSEGQCAVECMRAAVCCQYQYKTDKRLCELFAFIPTNLGAVPHCSLKSNSRYPSVCPIGFTPVMCSCFRRVMSHSWYNATDTCLSMNPPYSRLVTIEDELTDTALAAFPDANTCFWTSGQRITLTLPRTPMVWKPRYGSIIPMTYTNWSANEPGPYNCMRTCGPAYPNRWVALDCGLGMHAICEIAP